MSAPNAHTWIFNLNGVIFEWIRIRYVHVLFGCDRMDRFQRHFGLERNRAVCVYVCVSEWNHVLAVGTQWLPLKSEFQSEPVAFINFFLNRVSIGNAINTYSITYRWTLCVCVFFCQFEPNHSRDFFFFIVFVSVQKLNDAIKIEYNQNLNKLRIGFTSYDWHGMKRRHKTRGTDESKTEDDDDDQRTLVSEAFSAFDRRTAFIASNRRDPLRMLRLHFQC